MTSHDSADQQPDMDNIAPKPAPRTKKLKKHRCKLDDKNCLNLGDVILSFNGPISQEQAWAICHQTAEALSRLSPKQYYQLSDFSDIKLHKEGYVLLDSAKVSKNSSVPEHQVVFTLGHLLFQALDYGLSEEEESILSSDLETLIMSMTEPTQDLEERSHETDDEGIETDSGVGEFEDVSFQSGCSSYDKHPQVFLLENVIGMCELHANKENHDDISKYYREIISTVVRETLELTQFIDTVGKESKKSSFDDSFLTENSKHQSMSMLVDTYDFNDWARFWVQVIGELRRGVKLKKVEANLNRKDSKKGTAKRRDFELTPYEILMDDIRQRRYHLKKAPEPSQNTRKDARAIIMEFIRSRPRLKKASDRKLPPLKKEYTLRELLMENIRKAPKLRPAGCRRGISPLQEVPLLTDVHSETRPNERGTKPAWRCTDNTNENVHATSTVERPRKLIPVDFDLKLDADDDDDDDDLDDDFEISKLSDEEDEHGRPSGIDDDDEPNSANPWRRTGGLRLTKNEYHRFCDAQLEFYDLATQCPSRRASMRKHTARESLALPLGATGTTSLPQSRPQSRQRAVASASPNLSLNASPSRRPTPRPRGLSVDKEDRREDVSSDDKIGNKNLLADMFLDERLSLTLEEIVHIRSVLTKAELESLPVEGRVKEDVEKRRVCFLCLKTRFGILGPWGQRCKLCERTVCVKCYAKMRIPTEHFAHVPVVLLSPGLLSPSSSDADSGQKSPWSKSSVGMIGSAPASPASRRKDSALRGATPSTTPQTTPGTVPTPPEKRSYGSPSKLSNTATFGVNPEQRLAADRLRGVSMVVCHDCRIMVLQIIKSSRTTRATIRNNVISRLTLNLTPTYV